jgi:hypothetical protein
MKMYLLMTALLVSLTGYAQQSQTCCMSKPSCQIVTCNSKASASENQDKADVKTASVKSNVIEVKSSGAFLLSTLIANAIAMISHVTCDPTNCDPSNCIPGCNPPSCDPVKCNIESCKKK